MIQPRLVGGSGIRRVLGLELSVFNWIDVCLVKTHTCRPLFCGFVLIINILLMVQLAVVAVKLLSLARIPLRTTSVTGAQATGHANARLALTGGALVCSLFADEIRFVIGEHYQLICPGVVTYLNIPVQRDDFNRATFALQW